MGTWGAGLYDDDAAADLKTEIALLTKVPADGRRLLELLQQTNDHPAPASEDGCLFWLVLADQFERRGIACEEVAATALTLIESGTALDRCIAAGADAKFVGARRNVLLELAARLREPRPQKPVKKAGKPPPLVLTEGQVFAFPTMAGRAWHPYRLHSDGPFTPDGWGSLVVLATGRAYDWLPWVALASLTGDPHARPTLAAALNERIIPHPQTHGAGRFVPKAAHAKGLGLELLGTVELNADLVRPQLSKWPVSQAIRFDWTIAYGALSPTVVGRGGEAGVVLGSLLAGGG